MKTIKTPLIKLLTVISVMTVSTTASALSYTVSADSFTETPDNPISSEISNPTMFDFDVGSNPITFTTDTANSGADYISFTIGENETLDAVIMKDFMSMDGSDSNQGFFGIIDANNGFPTQNPGADGLLFGALYGKNNVGSDLLEIPGVDPQSSGAPDGFTFADVSSLSAGTYLFWFNETGAENIYTLDFQLSVNELDPAPVPVPAALYLMLAPLASLAAFRKRKQQSA